MCWRLEWETGSFSSRMRSLMFFLYVQSFDPFFSLISSMNNTVSSSCTKSLPFQFPHAGSPHNDWNARARCGWGLVFPACSRPMTMFMWWLATGLRGCSIERDGVVVPVSKLEEWDCKWPVMLNPLLKFMFPPIDPDLVCLRCGQG